MSKHTKGLLGGDDFNSKSRLWGSPRDHLRGVVLVEWFGKRDLIVFNNGDKPSFVSGDSKSWIDITIGTANLGQRIRI